MTRRQYPEPEHPYRSAFQRDCGRIIHSRAFRRLAGKTQVFTERGSDHFRSRLTHTMEVAQIARTIARALGLNEDLTEALALAHDIGHPPFGHAGERALDDELRRYGLRFDHNLHALRIVEYFENRHLEFRGLNLTLAVREGIVKHSRDYSRAEHPELQEYFLDQRPPLEAQLIDLADEIAYNTADLDDAFSAGLFGIAEICSSVAEFEKRYQEAEGHFPAASERELFQEVVRGLVDWLVSGLIQGTIDAAESANIADPSQVREHPRRLASLTPGPQATNRQLKQFLHHTVYFSPLMVEERRKSAAMIAELFKFYLAHPENLPENYAESLAQSPVHRVVCDYIAGMTDGFFLRTYRETLGA